MATELDANSFWPFVQAHPATFIHFWAEWNGYDMRMMAVTARIEPEYADRVAFGTLDVDPQAHHAICTEHRVQGPPFYAYYRAGQLQKSEVGVLTERELRTRLDDLLLTEDPV